MRHSGSMYSRPTPVPKMPPGLVELMEGLTKDVLKHNPPDVYEFCANHMQKLLEIRDGPSHLKAIPLDRKIKRAQEIIRKRSEQYWRNKIAVEEKITQKVLNTVHYDNDLTNASEIEIPCVSTDTLTTLENSTDTKNNKEIDSTYQGTHEVVTDSTADCTAGEAKQDHQCYEIVNKDATESILSNDDMPVGKVDESETLKPVENIKQNLSTLNNDNNPSNSLEKTEQNLTTVDDINVIENLEVHSISHETNIKEEIVDINDDQSYKAVDDSQEKNQDEVKSCQNEVVINYTETEENAENNSGVEIYVTDDSEKQSIHIDDAVAVLSIDRTEADQTEEDQDVTKSSINIPNLTINKENQEVATDMLSNFNDSVHKPLAEPDGNDSITEKIVETGHKNQIEDVIAPSPKEDEEKIHLKNTVFNIHENIMDSDRESETVEHISENHKIDANVATNTEGNTGELNESPNEGKQENISECTLNSVEKEEYLKKSNANDENIPVKDVLPLSEIVQNLCDKSYAIKDKAKDAQNHLDEPSSDDTRLTAVDKNVTNVILRDPLEASEKQVSEEDVSDNSEIMSHDNLQTEIIADIKENLEETVRHETPNPTNTNAVETAQNYNAENAQSEIHAPVDECATEESYSINSLIEGGTTDCSDETVQNDSANTMDLETAAVTIQKVFRTFLFKSRASTFDESANDENNLSDDDNDEDNKDSRSFLPPTLNKDRRPLGISRMDTVLQTVNEEKSLSLSTDDSSTLSSAATVIQAHVRGYLVRNKQHSGKTTSSTNSLINSDGPSTTSLEGDGDQHKSKTILNIHIVPEGNNFLSRDESIITSMDLSLDGSPPSSVNLHPLSYDKITERRKQLKREDAIQSVSPPSNNSGKLSEDVDSVKELQSNSGSLANASLEQETAAAIITNDEINQESKIDSVDTTPTNSITVETVIEIETTKSNPEMSSVPEPVQDISDKTKKSLIKQSSDEMDVVTPYKGNTPRDSETSGLLHTGEFHDTVLPTKVSRSDTPVVSEFKNVLVYFLLWNNS